MATSYERPPLFDECQYERTVLHLADSTTEDDLDEQIRAEAQQIGINLNSVSEESHFLNGDPRSRLGSSAGSGSTRITRTYSIDSRTSFSTDITSNPSRSSTDHRRMNIFSLPLRNFSRLSVSKSIADSGKSIASTSDSASSISFSQSRRSSLSLAPSSYTSSSGRNSVGRHLGLRRFRKSGRQDEWANFCFRCRQLSSPNPSPCVYRLQCGHGFCHDHLLHVMRERGLGIQTGLTACCLKQTLQSAMSSIMPYQANDACLTPSDSRLVKIAENSIQTTTATAPSKAAASRDPEWLNQRQLNEGCQRNLELAMSNLDFQQLRHEQSVVLDRFDTFHENHRSLLSDHHTKHRFDRLSQHKQALAELYDAHLQVLGKLEDKHVNAEIDLGEMHDQERSNCALALYHMEGYMKSRDPDGTGVGVTEKDKRELQKQYWVRDNMESRHQSAINVLREQQARVYRMRARAQEKEFAVLQLKHQRELNQLDRTCEAEILELEELRAQRRFRLLARLGLQDEVWRRKHNEKTKVKTNTTEVPDPNNEALEITTVPFPIPPITFPLEATRILTILS